MDGRVKHMLESTEEQSMTPETACTAGIKFGTKFKTVAVFRDADPSSQMIADALISGLLSAGADVTYAGLLSVPAAHAAYSSSFSCLLSVGNPDTENSIAGIRAYSSDGTLFDSDRLYEIMKVADSDPIDYRGVGQLRYDTSANGKYITQVKTTGITSQSYVILDCGCGSTSLCAPQLMVDIGAEVVAFNAHPLKGQRPRAPGLNKTNLMNISNFVNASIGSIGISFNGDGTRLAVMDENGKYVPGDRLLALMLMYLEPETAVVPFDSPCVVEDAFMHPLDIRGMKHKNIADRKLIRTKNDINSVIEAMKENNADFGALNDGTFIFPSLGYCPDAMYAAAVISELAGKRSIRNVLEEIPIYSNRTIRINFDGNMTHFANKLKEKIKEYDIITVSTSGNAWKMVLKNGTYVIKQNEIDPKKLVIFAESSDVVYLITMLEQARDIINYCI